MSRGFSRMAILGSNTFFRSSASLGPEQLRSPSLNLPLQDSHLWYTKPGEVKSESLIKQYFDILSPCEREKVLEMRGEELRRSALLSRVLVRTTIARYQTLIVPSALKFKKNRYGKPEVDWGCAYDWEPIQLNFNISHTPSLVACAVTSSSHIGVDVEEKQRATTHDILSLAKRYFSEHENLFLASTSDPQVQRLEFLKLWTLKESYVKAIGKGFSGAPFKTFTIKLKSMLGTPASTSDNKAAEIVVESAVNSPDFSDNWKFLVFELENSHFVAICTEKHCASEDKEEIPMNVKVWRTIPCVEDECVSGTDAVKLISGLT